MHLETIALKKPEYARDCGIEYSIGVVLFPEKSVLSNNLLMQCFVKVTYFYNLITVS